MKCSSSINTASTAIKQTARTVALLLFVTGIPAGHTQGIELSPVDPPRRAPELMLPDIHGDTVSMDALKGKVVMVNFWATWCPPCLSELPSMNRLDQALDSSGFELLAVNVGESAEEIRLFLDRFETELGFTLLVDEETEVTRAWPVLALPTSFIVGTDGKLHYRVMGEREWDHPEMIARIENLMTGSTSD